MGMDKKQTLMMVIYHALAVLANAIVKLVQIGQTRCQRILTDQLAQGESLIECALSVAEEEIGWFAPFVDIASARHETAYSRLFIS